MDQVSIQYKFTIERDGLRFTDALYFSPEEYQAKKSEDIEALKEQRFTNFKAVVTAKPPELTKEQLLAQVAEEKKAIEEQLVAVTARETELNAVKAEVVEEAVEEIGK